MTISIIIPTLNEEGALPSTLEAISRCVPPPLEVLIVDGGSRDRTRAVAEVAGARFIIAPRLGRGDQMNHGAARARGDIFYFVHADTRIPPTALAAITEAVDEGFLGGAFTRRFDHPSRLLKFTSWLAGYRSRWWGYFLGDQTIFATREAFLKCGGYRTWSAFEDPQFSRDLRRIGKTTTLTPAVVSSARRFIARGPWKQTWEDLKMTMAYLRRGGWE